MVTAKQSMLKTMNKPKRIVNFIGKNYACKLKKTLLNGDCLYNSVLERISRHHQRYTSSLLRKHAAFYLASYPEVFASQIRALVDEPLESYILNQFHRYAHGDYLILGVIAVMWNFKMTIITLELEDIKFFTKVKPLISSLCIMVVIVWKATTQLQVRNSGNYDL